MTTTTASERAATTTPAGSAAASETAGSGAADGGLAKPGTALSYGQSAIVPYKDPLAAYSAPATGRLKITVSSVRKAAPDDFKNVELNASEKPEDMYYVSYSITNVGGGDVNKGDSGGPSLEADDSSGQEASAVTIIGDFSACEWKAPPKPFPHGSTWTNCDIYDAPGGIEKVTYDGNVTSYFESPVAWR